MKVICAGMPKTGTKSISKALRHLGFTVFDWEEQILDFLDHWVDVFQNGINPDVKRVYQNADAVLGHPGSFFYEEILEAFPDCKVILSVRDEDSWLKSAVNQMETTFALRPQKFKAMLSPTARRINYILDCYIDASFGSCNSKSTCVFRKRYRIHNHRVRSIVPADKLLVYNVKRGWKPLCEFLGCDIPTIPFPRENFRAEISYRPLERSRSGRQIKQEIQRGFMVICFVFVIIVASCFVIYMDW